MKSYNLNLQCEGDEADALKRATEFVGALRESGHHVHVAALTSGDAANVLNKSVQAKKTEEPEKVVKRPVQTPPENSAAKICEACAGSGTTLPGSGVPCDKCGGTGNEPSA